MSNYDTWLQQPYQDDRDAQDAYDEAEESYRESGYYWESYEEWAEANEGKSQKEWEATADYVESVQSYQEMKNEVPTREEYEKHSGW